MVVSALAITLWGPDEPWHVGVPLPISIEVRNLSRQSIWVVGVMDGSEEGIRYPHYLPLIALAGQVIAKPPPPEDPLVGPLRRADFRLLTTDESFDPTSRHLGASYLPISTFSNFVPTAPGQYEFSLTLSTESHSPEQWLGRFGQGEKRSSVLELISQVPRLTTKSNVLVVEVV